MGFIFRLAALAVLMTPACARADEVVSVYDATLNDASADFRLASDVLPNGSIRVVNGEEVDPADWESLVFAPFYAPGATNPGANCTGTLVGPYVLLTAAHCIDRGNVAPRQARLRIAGVSFPFVCEMHPAYRARAPRERVPRGPEDYALCELRMNHDPPPALANLSFPGVDILNIPQTGAGVILTGFGCTNYEDETPRGARKLNIGHTATTPPEAQAPKLIASRADISYQSALCPGDSGGPLLREANPALTRTAILGVNSWIRTERVDGKTYVSSYVAPTGRAIFRNWVRTWLGAHPNAVICGVNDIDASPCRQ